MSAIPQGTQHCVCLMELSEGIRLPLLTLQYLRLLQSANEMDPYLILGNQPHSIRRCSVKVQILNSKLGPCIGSLSHGYLNDLEKVGM
jgi:hypothetical protein